uniref:Amino acid transporter transmembrane domain-containing protein n=1 Tax=Globisporangium ultimum (strain ATCC 200006 / CBS 805.95 / DAOM BR144) TaxID=431595 RepID=K3X1R2_GLOUD
MGILRPDAAHEKAPLLLPPLGKKQTPLPTARDDAHATEEDSPQHLASDAKTFASAIISFLGSGVLGFPFAFKQTGIILGLALLVLVGVISTFCMLLVVKCKYKLKSRGVHVAHYGQIGHFAMGTSGQLLVNFALIVSQTGFAVAYLIFIATNAHTYFSVSKEAVVLACLPFLIVLSLLKHIKELAWVALAADTMNFFGLAIVYMTDFSLIDLSSARTSELNWLGTLSSIPFFFGIATYCFSGIGMILPLEKAMENKAHFPRILMLTVALIGSIYASFGISGYLAFGESTEDVVTLNIQGHGGLATTVKLFLCAGLFFAYPMMLFPVFEVLQPAILKNVSTEQNPETKRIVFRSIFVLCTALVAAGVPNFGLFISFLGSTCCSLLGFVLPVVFYLQIVAEENGRSWHQHKLLMSIMTLGCFAVVTGFCTTAVNFF